MAEKKIVINVGDEAPEPNGTLLALLRDGEKRRPGDPRGELADRLGAEVQTFMASQTGVARHRRAAVKGSITLKIDFVSGPDGSHTYTVNSAIKTAKVPPSSSMTFADDDGEITGRPVEPLTEEMYRREREEQAEKATKKTNGKADPKVGTASSL